MTRFGVWCEVYGGVTGHRQAWMKNEQGEPKIFETLEEADAMVRTMVTGLRPSGVTFRYEVREMS